jgi:two-component system sensor histidine kinase RegB
MILTLKYLLLFRIFALGGQVLALVFMQQLFSIQLPLIPVISVIVVLGIITYFSWGLLQAGKSINNKTFVVQLLVDVIALSVLIYFTGGSINPLISLFILPIVFASASLNLVITTLTALAAVTCYSLLMFYHMPLSHEHAYEGALQLHLWGMWYGFILSAGLVAYFISRIAATLREQERELAEAREDALRADQILALGTLAAGTAHELGTPLSTMAVLTKELEYEHHDKKDLVDNLHLLRNQIDRCKNILARMASDAGQIYASSGQSSSVDVYIDNIISDWRKLRSEININVNLHGQDPAPEIITDQTVTQAILNVLNNAADASTTAVDIECSWSNDSVHIEIRDDGAGVPEIDSQLGEEIFTTKSPDKGLGIGLFLAQTTLKRLGGSIRFTNLNEGGTHAVIHIPLTPLLAR